MSLQYKDYYQGVVKEVAGSRPQRTAVLSRQDSAWYDRRNDHATERQRGRQEREAPQRLAVGRPDVSLSAPMADEEREKYSSFFEVIEEHQWI